MFDGVSSPFLPILDQDFVTWRIITGIRQNEPYVYMPWVLGYSYILRGILPVWLFDRTMTWLGINSSMDDFKGSKSVKNTK